MPRSHAARRSTSHRVTSASRRARRPMSKRRLRVTLSPISSSVVSRSKSSVPLPDSRMTRATNRLRGLYRLLPLPCAKTTTPFAPGGIASAPSSVTAAQGIRTSSGVKSDSFLVRSVIIALSFDAHTLPALLSAVLRRALHSIASRLTHRLREERFDGFFQVGALAFRAVHLLRLVLLDGQHFVKFVMTLAANVFVKRHRSVQLGVENPVRFFRESSLTNLAKSSPALPVPCRRCTVICPFVSCTPHWRDLAARNWLARSVMFPIQWLTEKASISFCSRIYRSSNTLIIRFLWVTNALKFFP